MHSNIFNLENLSRKLIFLVFLSSSFSSLASGIEKQRILYEEAVKAFKSDDLKRYENLKRNLQSYPLYPYLEYREIKSQLKTLSYQDVANFEFKYSDLPFIHSLRNRYLYTLASQKDWKSYLKYQKNEPFSQTHKCHYYYAQSQVGNKNLALKGAQKLYMSGSSISSACDKLFKLMKKENQLNDAMVLKRMLLVFEKGNKNLLKYLSRQVSPQGQKQAMQVLAYFSNPKKVLKISSTLRKNPYQQKLYFLAFKRLGRYHSSVAIENFNTIAKGLNLDKSQKKQIAEYIANRIMSTTEPKLAIWRDKWLSQSKNQRFLERRFRVALVANDWRDKEKWITLLSKDKQKAPKWQYWQARLLIQKGKKRQAEKLLRNILGQRNFYSVAAAMHLNENINIPLQRLNASFTELNNFQNALARITELEALNKTSDSKNEWRKILSKANNEEKRALAAYALNKNWYAHSVQATISGKLWGYLEYRFPVAHRWFFEQYSRENKLPITTLLALSRQESAFHINAISPVGARGLMQLMPATAKETSSKLGLTYSGLETLYDPGTNIQIGSGYLRMLLDKFEQNRILAFAAYNAGPHRVDSWLKRSQGNLDVIAFIEGIPFYETRGYVQNVLMYEVYYRKLLGMPLQFLDEKELAYNY